MTHADSVRATCISVYNYIYDYRPVTFRLYIERLKNKPALCEAWCFITNEVKNENQAFFLND